MKNYNDFFSKRGGGYPENERISLFVEIYLNYKKINNKPLKLLDIGCGEFAPIYKYKKKDDSYHAVDYFKSIKGKKDKYFKIDLNSEPLNKKIKEKYDVIFCGEVIEHLYSTDDLLDEIKKLMHEDSILILSTPNLAYYLNRILLLLGISPLFIENSSEQKLGRRFKKLGQGNLTEGHVKVFTYGALLDLFKIKKLRVEKIISLPVWGFFPDKIITKVSHSLSPDNIYILKLIK